VNLGTPDSPRTHDVRRYLREFLSDPRVLDSFFARVILLNTVILPFRPARSAEAYQKIWTAQGSPLLIHTRALADAVAEILKDSSVKFAMRYGSPSIASALNDFHREGVQHIRVLPLYPQYSTASTGSSIAELYECAAQMNDPFEFEIVPPFFDHPDFVDACARVAERTLEQFSSSSAKGRRPYVLFSFHGLPERQIQRSTAHLSKTACLSSADCCDDPGARINLCYRAQSFR